METLSTITPETVTFVPRAGGIVTTRPLEQLISAASQRGLQLTPLVDGRLSAIISREMVPEMESGPAYGYVIYWDDQGRIDREDTFDESGNVDFITLFELDEIGRLRAIRTSRKGQSLGAEEYEYLDGTPDSKYKTFETDESGERKEQTKLITRGAVNN